MSNVYDIGDGIRLSATFTVNAVATNPTTVTVTLTDPSGNATAPTTTNDGTGAYHADVLLDEAGKWYYRFVGTGAVIAASQADFFVRKLGS